MTGTAIEHALNTDPGRTRVVTEMPGVITDRDITIAADYDMESLKPGVLVNPALGHTAIRNDIEVDGWDVGL